MRERTTNEKLKTIKPSPIRAFNDSISNIEGLVRLTLGEPDFQTPQFIKDAAIEGIQGTNNGYTHSKGTIELRQSIQGYLQRKYKLDYDPETQLIATVGATEGIFTSLYALLNPGDKVAVADPSYAVYKTQVSLAGGELVPVDVAENKFLWTPEQLDQVLTEDPAIKVLLLNYPSNPTGKTYNAEQLEALAKVVEKHNIWVLSDEIYAELSYDYKHVSMASFLPEHTVLINGASKSHSMTGWRMGFIAGPKEVMQQIFVIHQGSVNTPTTQAQFAATAAYSPEGDAYIESMKREYVDRRNYLIDNLHRIGYNVDTPEGAFYLFVQVPDWYDGDDMAFCLALAHEAKVGVVPGQAFGEGGINYFRISYAASHSDLQEFITRLEDFTNKNK